MFRMLIGLIFTIALCAPISAADEPAAPFAVTGWQVDRVRKDVHGSNLVTARFSLQNNLSKEVSNLRIVIDYREMGESAKKTEIDLTQRLKPGESVEKAIAQTWVPEFTDYLITIDYTADGKQKTALLAGDSPIATPEPYSDEPIPGVSKVKLIGRSMTIENTWTTGIEAIIRNFGELPAYGVQLEVTFTKMYNRRPVVLGTELVDFDTSGTVPGGKTAKAAMRFKKPYNGYDDCKVRLVIKDVPAETSLAGQPFLNHAEVEAGLWKFERSNKDRDLTIRGTVRNGMADTVCEVALQLTLTSNVPVKNSLKRPKETKPEIKTITVKLPGKLEKGKTFEFATELLKDCPRIDDLTTAFEFQLGEPAAAAVTPTGAPASTPAPATGNGELPPPGNTVDLVPGLVAAQADGSTKVEVQVRNGSGEDVRGLKIIFTFTLTGGGTKKAEVPLKGTLKAGKNATLKLSLPDIGAFTTYSYAISYGD